MTKVRYALFLRPRIVLLACLLYGMCAIVVMQGTVADTAAFAVAAAALPFVWFFARALWREPRRVALHEAAHIVLAWNRPILPDVQWAAAGALSGATQLDVDGEDWSEVGVNPSLARSFLVMLFAGIAVEMHRYGLPTPGAVGDFQTAERLVQVLNSNGIPCSSSTLEAALATALHETQLYSAKIERVADALQARGILHTEDIAHILGPRAHAYFPA